eukprot:TRINITY_DN5041_c0_g1_i1.p1 TRINITY_DN5041_c0_g1~~TRINITY_DN5041_c0_g1_i1.p1  ORF type:complete len:1206 (-),score=200.54 TRINITY_DN5041_c0_g1_i1:193-3810(-)
MGRSSLRSSLSGTQGPPPTATAPLPTETIRPGDSATSLAPPKTPSSPTTAQHWSALTTWRANSSPLEKVIDISTTGVALIIISECDGSAWERDGPMEHGPKLQVPGGKYRERSRQQYRQQGEIGADIMITTLLEAGMPADCIEQLFYFDNCEQSADPLVQIPQIWRKHLNTVTRLTDAFVYYCGPTVDTGAWALGWTNEAGESKVSIVDPESLLPVPGPSDGLPGTRFVVADGPGTARMWMRPFRRLRGLAAWEADAMPGGPGGPPLARWLAGYLPAPPAGVVSFLELPPDAGLEKLPCYRTLFWGPSPPTSIMLSSHLLWELTEFIGKTSRERRAAGTREILLKGGSQVLLTMLEKQMEPGNQQSAKLALQILWLLQALVAEAPIDRWAGTIDEAMATALALPGKHCGGVDKAGNAPQLLGSVLAFAATCASRCPRCREECSWGSAIPAKLASRAAAMLSAKFTPAWMAEKVREATLLAAENAAEELVLMPEDDITPEQRVIVADAAAQRALTEKLAKRFPSQVAEGASEAAQFAGEQEGVTGEKAHLMKFIAKAAYDSAFEKAQIIKTPDQIIEAAGEFARKAGEAAGMTHQQAAVCADEGAIAAALDIAKEDAKRIADEACKEAYQKACQRAKEEHYDKQASDRIGQIAAESERKKQLHKSKEFIDEALATAEKLSKRRTVAIEAKHQADLKKQTAAAMLTPGWSGSLYTQPVASVSVGESKNWLHIMRLVLMALQTCLEHHAADGREIAQGGAERHDPNAADELHPTSKAAIAACQVISQASSHRPWTGVLSASLTECGIELDNDLGVSPHKEAFVRIVEVFCAGVLNKAGEDTSRAAAEAMLYLCLGSNACKLEVLSIIGQAGNEQKFCAALNRATKSNLIEKALCLVRCLASTEPSSAVSEGFRNGSLENGIVDVVVNCLSRKSSDAAVQRWGLAALGTLCLAHEKFAERGAVVGGGPCVVWALGSDTLNKADCVEQESLFCACALLRTEVGKEQLAPTQKGGLGSRLPGLTAGAIQRSLRALGGSSEAALWGMRIYESISQKHAALVEPFVGVVLEAMLAPGCLHGTMVAGSNVVSHLASVRPMANQKLVAKRVHLIQALQAMGHAAAQSGTPEGRAKEAELMDWVQVLIDILGPPRYPKESDELSAEESSSEDEDVVLSSQGGTKSHTGGSKSRTGTKDPQRSGTKDPQRSGTKPKA